MRTADGFRIFKPRLDVRNVKVAYGVECARIWMDATREYEATGVMPDYYVPTEDEFRAARAAFGRRKNG